MRLTLESRTFEDGHREYKATFASNAIDELPREGDILPEDNLAHCVSVTTPRRFGRMMVVGCLYSTRQITSIYDDPIRGFVPA